MLFGLARKKRIVQVVSLVYRVRILPGSAVRIERVNKFVMALIGMRIGPGGRTKQRKAQDVALGVVAVLAVIQQAEAVLAVGQVGPSDRRDFKFSLLRGRAPRRRPLNAPIRDLKSGFFVVGAEREANLQQNVLLVPFDLGLYVDSMRVFFKSDVPDEGGVLKMLFDANHGAQGAAFYELYLIGRVKVPMMFLEIRVDVPRV